VDIIEVCVEGCTTCVNVVNEFVLVVVVVDGVQLVERIIQTDASERKTILILFFMILLSRNRSK
jgi:hypothetical protein